MKENIVSIIVVSYNSEKTIIETLESIKSQTYKSIELIVSDDSSNDSTVCICKDWLIKNKGCFERSELLTSEKNQGVCANLNKALAAANGEWVKGVAADDILMPNCVTDFMSFVENHPEASIVASYISIYNGTFDRENCIVEKKGLRDLEIFNQPIEIQLRQMAYDSFIQATSVFFKKEVFNAVGGFTDKYPYEDHPFYMDALEKGYRIFFLDKVTGGYRVHQSASNSSIKLFNYHFLKKTHRFIKDRCFKYYSTRKKTATYMRWFNEWLLFSLHLDNDNKINRTIYKFLFGLTAIIGGKIK